MGSRERLRQVVELGGSVAVELELWSLDDTGFSNEMWKDG